MFKYVDGLHGVLDSTNYLVRPLTKKEIHNRSLCTSELNSFYSTIGIKINNPYPKVEHIALTETEIKSIIDKTNDPICGIYENIASDKLKLACIKHENTYKLVFLDEIVKYGLEQHWETGDVKGYLSSTATDGLFKVSYYSWSNILSDKYITFSDGIMKIIQDDETEEVFLKLYPISSSNTESIDVTKWSGTGFAIGNNCIVTNHHVIDEAKTIKIKGVKGNFEVQYQAEVIASDRNNDLALLKITDSQFAGFANIPYAAKTTLSDVG